jgi:hypothetical protein
MSLTLTKPVSTSVTAMRTILLRLIDGKVTRHSENELGRLGGVWTSEVHSRANRNWCLHFRFDGVSGDERSLIAADRARPAPEVSSPTSSTAIEGHKDVVALSKLLSHLDTGPLSDNLHHRHRLSSHSLQAVNQALV